MPQKNIEAIYPLSHSQQGMLLLAKLDQLSDAEIDALLNSMLSQQEVHS